MYQSEVFNKIESSQLNPDNCNSNSTTTFPVIATTDDYHHTAGDAEAMVEDTTFMTEMNSDEGRQHQMRIYSDEQLTHNPPLNSDSLHPIQQNAATLSRTTQNKEDEDDNENGGHKKRRMSILSIMKDPSLTPFQRRRSIQGVMDGRTTFPSSSSSFGGAMIEGGLLSSGYGQDGSVRMARMIAYSPATGEPIGNPESFEKSRPICSHYDRNCSIISPCCGLVFGCRLCHDECKDLLPPIFNKYRQCHNPNSPHIHDSYNLGRTPTSCDPPDAELGSTEVTDSQHVIDRFQIQEIICRHCFTRQSSKTNSCSRCHIRFSEYHCSICNLWMSNKDNPFHCADCGFCRVRGPENQPFQHCHECNMCILANCIQGHNCKKDKYTGKCPICFEDLFSSRTAVHEMSCGHSIHWTCFQSLLHDGKNKNISNLSSDQTQDQEEEEEEGQDHGNNMDTTWIQSDVLSISSSRCPLCKKTAESYKTMIPQWEKLALDIQLQPLPIEYTRVVSILCNDCSRSGQYRPWHFLGVQCLHCKSFNTTTIKTLLVGEDAVSFLSVTTATSNDAIDSDSSTS